MLGVNTTPSLFIFTVTRNVVLAPIIEQVRRATIIQRHLKLNKGCKVKPERANPEAIDQPIAAQAAQAWQQAVGRYLTTE